MHVALAAEGSTLSGDVGAALFWLGRLGELFSSVGSMFLRLGCFWL